MTTLQAVHDLGQSIWLNYLRRALIESGELRRVLAAGVRGVTITPSVVERAVTSSSDYDTLLERLISNEKYGGALYEALLIDDVQRAADILYPTYDASEHVDGFVTLPLNAELAHNAVSMAAEGTRLGGICAAVNRTNIMIEVPATVAGIRALRALIADGCNVRVTHIFSLSTYEDVTEAYLSGLEQFLETHSVWRLTPSSLASVPLGAIDWEIDRRLELLGRRDLQGKAAVALAKVLYARSREIYGSSRWLRLQRRGAKEQRLLWINSASRRFDRADTYYVDALIGPQTVHSLSPATFHAFRDHGTAAPTLTEGLEEARAHLQSLKALGIEIEAEAQTPLERRLQVDTEIFHRRVRSAISKRDQMDSLQQRFEIFPGTHAKEIEGALKLMCDEHVMCRIWEHDATVWQGARPDATALDWLHTIEPMQANVERMQKVVQDACNSGYREAVILAGGGAARVARLFAQTFGQLPYIPGVLSYTPAPHLKLTIVDTSAGSLSRDVLANYPVASTLFVLSDKSETTNLLPVFREVYAHVAAEVGKERAGDHFIVITDHGSPLAVAATRHGFRYCFLDHPALHDGYAALSYTGIFPAALAGVDLNCLVERAALMASNASGCNCPVQGDNIAAQLGTVIGVMAKAGHRHISLITSPFLEPICDWIQGFVAETLGAKGEGLEVSCYKPEHMNAGGTDEPQRLFVVMKMANDETHSQLLKEMQVAGRAVTSLHLNDPDELAGLLFTWQMAVAVAGYHLGANPFR